MYGHNPNGIKGDDLTWNAVVGITDSPLCRVCMEADETPTHVVLQCRGVAEQRAAYQSMKHLATTQVAKCFMPAELLE
ncbi:jg4773 [Pararge aegeria aegeria]|uniref:Jg4773 protein n=1 Tax=Pararge aegeria aegeria TaxID=348720 RepID=A0A8S4R7K0_9NEOP|nr:jg4773 [Pararge aegeria aegeria]